MRNIKLGSRYIHFKHEYDNEEDREKYTYEIKGIARHSETGEKLVIYQNLFSDVLYARPYGMFVSEVDKSKYPDIRQRYRFELLE